MANNTDSSLVTDILLLPNHFNAQKTKIVKDNIPHHAAGKTTVQGMYNIFRKNQCSANYGIARGRIALYVHEKDRAWTSSNKRDSQAITYEIGNSKCAPYWEVADEDVKNLILLMVDVCKRNNMPGPVWTGDTKGTLLGHYMFKATACPGPYLKALMPWIATEVTGRLNGVITGEIKIPKVTFNKSNAIEVKNSVVVKQPEPQKLSHVYGGVDLSPVFDYKYYADRYPDLKDTFGYNEEQLWFHFCTSGMNQARKASSMFDPVLYRANNKDVEARYGDNWKGYYAHYCQFGIKEGRPGC